MAENLVAIQLPESTYNRFKRIAAQTYRTVEDVVTSTLNASVSEHDNLPPEVVAELQAMLLYSDAALFAAMEPSMSAAAQERLRQINALAKEQPLTEPQIAEQLDLLHQYQLSVIRRAQAMAVLTKRGHDVLPKRD